MLKYPYKSNLAVLMALGYISYRMIIVFKYHGIYKTMF